MDQKDEREPADAFVFFGATGDLAQRKIYPALQAMIKKGRFDLPMILVARKTYDIEKLREKTRDSLQKSGQIDPQACDKLLSLMHFVGGDYHDTDLYPRIKQALGDKQRPLAYLAIPPSMFGTVATGLAQATCSQSMRILVEKPFGRDLQSSRDLNKLLHEFFPENAIYRIDHYLGKEAVQNLIYFHLANEIFDGCFHHAYVDHVEITMAETLGVEGRGKFYEEVGAIRDVIQNHMLQVIACLGMECPVNRSSEALRDEVARVIKAIPPLTPDDVVRGQYRGYLREPGVAPTSNVETFAAVRLNIENDRWDGVPFYLRVGKRMPVTATEIYVKFKRPLWSKIMPDQSGSLGNYLRLRISPDTAIAQGTRVKKPGAGMQGQCIELLASYSPPDEMLSYERLFLDAIAGDPELFAREDMIDAQWAVVDDILGDETPLHTYEQYTWGPSEAAGLLLQGVTWHDPVRDDETLARAASGGRR